MRMRVLFPRKFITHSTRMNESLSWYLRVFCQRTGTPYTTLEKRISLIYIAQGILLILLVFSTTTRQDFVWHHYDLKYQAFQSLQENHPPSHPISLMTSPPPKNECDILNNLSQFLWMQTYGLKLFLSFYPNHQQNILLHLLLRLDLHATACNPILQFGSKNEIK